MSKSKQKESKPNRQSKLMMFSPKEQAFFRLLSGQRLNIEPFWGITQMNKVLFIQDMNSTESNSLANMCQEEKDKTQNTLIYTRTSRKDQFKYEGNYDELDSIPKNSLAVVQMSGVMMVNDAMCSYGMNSMDRRLRMLYRDSRIDGVVISANTGGGQSTAGDILFNAIKDKNKPVVTHAVMLASAGIKGTLHSDEIIAASKSTIVGSIGTMMIMPKWYIEREKEDNIELYSSKAPNKNAAWRALKNGDVEPYIEQLTINDEQFMAEVQENRNLRGTKARVEETLSGATFPGIEAKSRGLVDGIGSLNYALKRLVSHIS